MSTSGCLTCLCSHPTYGAKVRKDPVQSKHFQIRCSVIRKLMHNVRRRIRDLMRRTFVRRSRFPSEVQRQSHCGNYRELGRVRSPSSCIQPPVLPSMLLRYVEKQWLDKSTVGPSRLSVRGEPTTLSKASMPLFVGVSKLHIPLTYLLFWDIYTANNLRQSVGRQKSYQRLAHQTSKETCQYD